MKRASKASPEPERLVVSIDRVERSYYISQYPTRAERAPAADEALVSLFGEITEASVRHQTHVRQQMEIALVCAGSGVDPFLLSVTLRGKDRSAMAYLPVDAFWALPAMLAECERPCAELVFERTRYGSGSLLSLWLGPREALQAI